MLRDTHISARAIPEEVFTDPPFASPASDARPDLRPAAGASGHGASGRGGLGAGDDGLLRNAAGQTLDVEFLNAGPLFDRIINPYVENLRAIGINARLTRVDGAQMNQRQRDADFDILTDHFPMSYEPGTRCGSISGRSERMKACSTWRALPIRWSMSCSRR